MGTINNKRVSTAFSLYDDDDETPAVPAKKPNKENSTDQENTADELAGSSVDSGTNGCNQGLTMLSYFAARQGEREDMQDTHIQLNHFDVGKSFISRCAVYSIFDGHGGTHASLHCEKMIADKLKNKLSSFADVVTMEKSLKKTFVDIFKEMDDSFLKLAKEQKPVWKDGTTATVALVLNNSIYVANIGDSKALVCRVKADGSLSPMPLTVDHSATTYDERMRIQKAGGSVINGRVNGVIEVSRSIGDGQFKNHGVISTPDMRKLTITENDRFLLIACDGLWKAFSNEEAIKFITDAINDSSKDGIASSTVSIEHHRWQKAVSDITAEAVKRKCGDNVSAILVKLEDIKV